MMLYMLMTISIYINMMMTLNFHPLSITLIIIIQTILNCLIMGSTLYSFWFSYIMILVFLGGMLVLFIYITSLTPNELFKMSTKFMMFLMLLTCITVLIIFMINTNPIIPFTDLDSINSFQLLMMNESTKNLTQIYNHPFSILTILTINYLLITMIAIVKITKFQEGPLRQIY